MIVMIISLYGPFQPIQSLNGKSVCSYFTRCGLLITGGVVGVYNALIQEGLLQVYMARHVSAHAQCAQCEKSFSLLHFFKVILS